MAMKYSVSDKELFIQILGNYSIIEDKKTDAFSIEKKRKAWEKIAADFNAASSETRTVTQLKRLWDKMKRSRKAELAQDRRELLATGGGPPKSSPPPQPVIDNLVPHIAFEVDVQHDSDGINLNKIEVIQISEMAPASSSSQSPPHSPVVIIDQVKEPGPSTSAEKRSPSLSSQGIKKLGKTTPRQDLKNKQIAELTGARLELIRKEEKQMDELHEIRLQEAIFKKEAARLQMLQEELKLKNL